MTVHGMCVCDRDRTSPATSKPANHKTSKPSKAIGFTPRPSPNPHISSKLNDLINRIFTAMPSVMPRQNQMLIVMHLNIICPRLKNAINNRLRAAKRDYRAQSNLPLLIMPAPRRIVMFHNGIDGAIDLIGVTVPVGDKLYAKTVSSYEQGFQRSLSTGLEAF